MEDARSSSMRDEMQQDAGGRLPFPVSPLWDEDAAVKMCVTANFLSVSVLISVSLTDGAADSGELDLSGIDDSEIELVCTC